MKSDKELLELLKKNNKKGIEYLFNRYYKPMVVFANTFLNDLQLSEDLVQEQFIKFWNKKLYAKIVPNALSTFLFTMVKNSCLTKLNKKELRVDLLDDTHLKIAEEEAKCFNEFKAKKVQEELNKLPQRTKQIVELIMISGYKYQEVADQLNISINTVKSMLKKGLKDIRGAVKTLNNITLMFFCKKIKFLTTRF